MAKTKAIKIEKPISSMGEEDYKAAMYEEYLIYSAICDEKNEDDENRYIVIGLHAEMMSRFGSVDKCQKAYIRKKILTLLASRYNL